MLQKGMAKFKAAQLVYQKLGAANTANYAQLLMQMGSNLGDQGCPDEANEKFLEAKRVFEACGAIDTKGYEHVRDHVTAVQQGQGRSPMKKRSQSSMSIGLDGPSGEISPTRTLFS